jgi:NAD(P)-dependent dehydrogenase (short-subunit alcohol dehydrogenase family)
MASAFLPLLSTAAKSTKGYASQVINVSSISGLLKSASGGQFAYAASKAAVVQVSGLRVCSKSLTDCSDEQGYGAGVLAAQD